MLYYERIYDTWLIKSYIYVYMCVYTFRLNYAQNFFKFKILFFESLSNITVAIMACEYMHKYETANGFKITKYG